MRKFAPRQAATEGVCPLTGISGKLYERNGRWVSIYLKGLSSNASLETILRAAVNARRTARAAGRDIMPPGEVPFLVEVEAKIAARRAAGRERGLTKLQVGAGDFRCA